MNHKRKNFFISNSILIAFIVIIVLVTNYFLVFFFGFNQDNFVAITLFLVFLGVFLNLFLGKPLLDPLFKSDDILEKKVKETLHELNIPVSTIKANTQMLEKKVSDEKSLKRINRIKQATDDLLKLYEQMEYEIKKEIDIIEKEKFSLKTLIEESIEKFSDIKGSIEIENRVEDIEVLADKNGFQKVIDNLISNAIKYSFKNSIVKINYENGILTIYNEGKSIDTKNLFIVFDKYFQEDSSADGFGLGLNIVKEYCDKNRINVNIEPKEQGTLVKLNLTRVLA